MNTFAPARPVMLWLPFVESLDSHMYVATRHITDIARNTNCITVDTFTKRYIITYQNAVQASHALLLLIAGMNRRMSGANKNAEASAPVHYGEELRRAGHVTPKPAAEDADPNPMTSSEWNVQHQIAIGARNRAREAWFKQHPPQAQQQQRAVARNAQRKAVPKRAAARRAAVRHPVQRTNRRAAAQRALAARRAAAARQRRPVARAQARRTAVRRAPARRAQPVRPAQPARRVATRVARPAHHRFAAQRFDQYSSDMQ